MFELVLFCYIWVSGMFYPINDINYGLIALVACNNSSFFKEIFTQCVNFAVYVLRFLCHEITCRQNNVFPVRNSMGI